MLSPSLLAVLACPKSRQPLVYFQDGDFLLCPASRLRYRIEGGVPVLLVEEAEELDQQEVDRLLNSRG
jgi:uncharacterized protein YbaR (Trm112 family)